MSIQNLCSATQFIMETKNKRISIYDITISNQVEKLKKEFKFSNTVLRGILGRNISISGVGELLACRNAWSASQVALIARYFAIPTDQLIFGDRAHIEKITEAQKIEALQMIKEFLIKEGSTNTLGKLTAEGFFDKLNK